MSVFRGLGMAQSVCQFIRRVQSIVVVFGLLLCWSCSVAAGSAINAGPPVLTSVANPVVFTPEKPEAHDPFEVEIFLGNIDAESIRALDIDIDSEYEGNTLIRVSFSAEHYTVAGRSTALTIHMGGGLSYGEYHLYAIRRLGHANDAVEAFFSIEPPPVGEIANSFYHPNIDHYFLTASPEEINEIVQAGWEYVGRNYTGAFTVWLDEETKPAAAESVCRFYSPVVNSHFYTGDPEECDGLKVSDSGWEYEGIAFWALLPRGSACPSRSTPVWRLFNNRQDELDSNHRFVARTDLYHVLMEDGWIGEGVAFCDPVYPPPCGFLYPPCESTASAVNRE